MTQEANSQKPSLRWGVDTCPVCYGVIGRECLKPADCAAIARLWQEFKLGRFAVPEENPCPRPETL